MKPTSLERHTDTTHTVHPQWTICLHGDTLTVSLTMFNDGGQYVYTEGHLQTTSQCSTRRWTICLHGETQPHTVQRQWTICLHGETLTTSHCSTTVDNVFTRRDTYNITLFNDGGQSVYTERHLQTTSQRRWTICLHGQTLTDNLTMFNLLTPGILGCGCICGEVRQTERHRQSSHCSRTVDTVLRAHTVQGLWTLC